MTFSRYAVVASLLTIMSLSTGCAWMQRGSSPVESPTPLELLTEFNTTQLGVSTSGDVLASAAFPGIEVISTSQNAVAISGPLNLADRTWATIVSFGDDSLTASGKYFMYVNDKPRGFFHNSVTNGRLDVEKIITPEVLSANYASDEARSLAVLRDILKSFNAAARGLKTQDARVHSCVMAANALLNEQITTFNTSPASLATISNLTGIAFEDQNMGDGRIKMIIDGNIVKLKIICGPVTTDIMGMPEFEKMGGKLEEKGFLSDYTKLEKRSANSLVYIAPGNPLGQYDKFIIDPVQLYHNGIPANGSDIEVLSGGKLSSQDALRMTLYLQEQLTSAVKNGYTVVREKGPGVARVRVAITDMTKSSFGRNLPLGMLSGAPAGTVSMEAELVDSVSGQQVAAIVETQSGNRFSWVDYSSWDDAMYVMDEWARRFKTRLDEAHGLK